MRGIEQAPAAEVRFFSAQIVALGAGGGLNGQNLSVQKRKQPKFFVFAEDSPEAMDARAAREASARSTYLASSLGSLAYIEAVSHAVANSMCKERKSARENAAENAAFVEGSTVTVSLLSLSLKKLPLYYNRHNSDYYCDIKRSARENAASAGGGTFRRHRSHRERGDGEGEGAALSNPCCITYCPPPPPHAHYQATGAAAAAATADAKLKSPGRTRPGYFGMSPGGESAQSEGSPGQHRIPVIIFHILTH
ncbi:hypothetical protein T492DRAFT_834642 [Pavlovales sp. CCMP2436]|nr:hypothetical protein T492DRAFT_834642 [Pavlovales sp. CCMP2436]